jgi:hypothetical protein
MHQCWPAFGPHSGESRHNYLDHGESQLTLAKNLLPFDMKHGDSFSHGEENQLTVDYGENQLTMNYGECLPAIKDHNKDLNNDGEITTKLICKIATDDPTIPDAPIDCICSSIVSICGDDGQCTRAPACHVHFVNACHLQSNSDPLEVMYRSASAKVKSRSEENAAIWRKYIAQHRMDDSNLPVGLRRVNLEKEPNSKLVRMRGKITKIKKGGPPTPTKTKKSAIRGKCARNQRGHYIMIQQDWVGVETLPLRAKSAISGPNDGIPTITSRRDFHSSTRHNGNG